MQTPTNSRLRQSMTAFKSIAVALVVVAAFFTVGFSWRDASISNFDPSSIYDSVASLPDRIELLMDQPSGSDKEIQVRTAYQNALNTIRDSFYPGASTLKTTVVKTPTNSVTPGIEEIQPTGAIDVKQLTYMAIRGTLAALDDPFTGFLDPSDYKQMREENEGNFVGIGAQLWTNKKGQVYVKEPLPDNPAIKAGVKKGDIIVKVDNISVAGKVIDDVVKMIRGPKGTRVTLQLARGEDAKTVNITIVRDVVEYRMVEHEMLDKDNGIGWLLLRQFNSKADRQMDEALDDLERNNLKALILDLRGNPGGLLESAVDIGSRFIKDGPVVIIQERGGQRSRLNVNPRKHNHQEYPLVVLIDEMSASASEIVAGAIKDTNAGMLVGTKSYGKGRVQTIVPLAGESAIRITTAKYLTPKGTDIHKLGILPDIDIKMPEDLPDVEDDETDRMANDPQLQKAVEVMRQQLATGPGKGTHVRR